MFLFVPGLIYRLMGWRYLGYLRACLTPPELNLISYNE
jgi:hypothetical protein